MSEAQQIVSRMWNYCHLLRDEGLSYLEYIEQLTYLLFLKMAHEKTLPPYSRSSLVPAGCDWPSLLARDGDELEAHYRHVLETLSRSGGTLGVIFRKAQNKIQNPALLRRLVADLIDKEQWTSLDADVRATPTKGSWRRTPRIPGAGPASTSRPGHSFAPSWR